MSMRSAGEWREFPDPHPHDPIPPDEFQDTVQDAVGSAAYKSIEYAFGKYLHNANWLPSLEAIAKLFK